MKITGKTKLLGLFANPAEHSKSPGIFNAVLDKLGLDYRYLAFRIPEGRIRDAVEAMKLLGMKGVNISMPHKEAIISYLDEISEEAKFCGAVNTVVNDEGRLKGYNTDIYGAVKAIENMDVDISRSDIAILGLGGAGKAVLTGVSGRRPQSIKVFVRGRDALLAGDNDKAHHAAEALAFVEKTKNKTGIDIELLDVENLNALRENLEDIDVLVNATGIGMGKNEGKSLIPDESYLVGKPAVLDVIYSPEQTKLLQQAEEAGCRYSNGINMLIYQGEIAFKLLVGADITIDDIRSAVEGI